MSSNYSPSRTSSVLRSLQLTFGILLSTLAFLGVIGGLVIALTPSVIIAGGPIGFVYLAVLELFMLLLLGYGVALAWGDEPSGAALPTTA